jgi:hypothetical protein
LHSPLQVPSRYADSAHGTTAFGSSSYSCSGCKPGTRVESLCVQRFLLHVFSGRHALRADRRAMRWSGTCKLLKALPEQSGTVILVTTADQGDNGSRSQHFKLYTLETDTARWRQYIWLASCSHVVCTIHELMDQTLNLIFHIYFYRSHEACALPMIRSKHEQYRFAFCSIDQR